MTDRSRLWEGVAAAATTCAAGVIVGTTAGAVIAGGVVVAAALATVAFLRVSAAHSLVARRLRARSIETEVAGTRLRLGALGGSVFVAGLARPHIFCDGALLEDLDHRELEAVTLHERAHQLARDPLRNALVAGVAPVLMRFDRGRGWLEHRAATREIRADRYAMANGADRGAIASALLKVLPAGAAHAAPFAPAVELRLRALLDDEVAGSRRRSWSAIAVGAVAGAAVCLAMLHPALQFAGIMQACCPV